MKIHPYFAGHMTKTVFAKTAGLSDRTAKFQNCLVNLSDSMSDKKLIQKNVQTVFFGVLNQINEDCTYFLHIFHQICSIY